MVESWPRAVVFDLDGTLIDSVGDIADALNAAIRGAGFQTFSDDDVRLMIGGGARVLIGRALAARGVAPDDHLSARLHDDFLAVYRSASVAKTSVYPHGHELLTELSGRGIGLAICTNKPTGITEDVLAKLGLRERFGAVVAGRDDIPKKPHPAMLEASLALLGVSAADAVMIGDSPADVGSARAAGVPVVAVSYGYTRVPPPELGADLVIDTLAEALAAIERLAAGRG